MPLKHRHEIGMVSRGEWGARYGRGFHRQSYIRKFRRAVIAGETKLFNGSTVTE